MLLRLARRLLRAPKTACRGTPLAPGRRKKKPPAAGGRALSRAEWDRKRYAEDAEYRARKLASNHAWDKSHRTQLNEARRRKRKTPKGRAQRRASRRKAKYGLSPDDFARMLARQKGRCASCRIRPAETLCVDHCHKTGMVRGLLCRKCNTGLGCFNDSPALMLKAMAYLYRHAAREIGARLAAWRAFISHLWQVPR